VFLECLGLVSSRDVDVSVSSRSRGLNVSRPTVSRDVLYVSVVDDNEYDTNQQPLTKKAKFFDFMAARRPGSVSASQTCSQERQPCPNLNKQFYDLHHSDGCDADSTCGLAAFNNPNLYGLRPLVQRLFCVPASSAASERLFSQAGLIMRPTRNRLSKDRLSQFVFLKCNMK